MNKINGVSVAVFNEDLVPIKVADDGYLGRLEHGKLVLQVTVNPDSRVHAFIVDGQKNVVSKKAEVTADDNDDRVYRLVISCPKSQHGEYYTVYPSNNLRVAEFGTGDNFNETGIVTLWEIAVISQNGEFFLTVQKNYELECYQDDGGRKMYPRFEKSWPQIDEYLVSLLPDSVSPAHVSSYTPDEEPPKKNMADNEGLVQWFNLAQGIGAIVTKKGIARIHWSQIEKRPRRAFLATGESVRFTELRTPRNTHGRGSSFKFEAVGIKIIN